MPDSPLRVSLWVGEDNAGTVGDKRAGMRIAATQRRTGYRASSAGMRISIFFGCVESLKHHAILTSCYAAGLRMSEAVNLKTSDIASQRMVIRVTQVKDHKSLPRRRPGTAMSCSCRNCSTC
jgi:hypothetical protein